MITTIIVFILVLGLLVFVHEFGHFIVAIKTGMKVEEFGFGFPPRLAGIQKINGKYKIVWGHKPPLDQEKTVYSINAIPFGGFVKIMGENNDSETDSRSFINRPFWARLVTLVAGVSMNWILAVVLFTSVFMVGTVSEIDKTNPIFKNAKITNEQIVIPQVEPNSPAKNSGLKEMDIILKVDSQSFANGVAVRNYIISNKGKIFDFEIKRGEEIKNFKIQSIAQPLENQGPTGIVIADIGILKLPFFSALKLGIIKTANLTQAIFSGFYQLFTSKEMIKSVGGPIKIAQITGEVYKMGLTSLMNFTGVLSVNLAVLNILPIPALDGGRVLFLVIEKIRGKKNNQKVEQWVNGAGFALLLALMLVVTVKDIFFK